MGIQVSSYFIKDTGKFNYFLIDKVYMFFPRNIRIYDNTKIFTAFYPFNIFTIDYQFRVQILQLGFSCTKYAVACFGNMRKRRRGYGKGWEVPPAFLIRPGCRRARTVSGENV